jgi:hypothetical protein
VATTLAGPNTSAVIILLVMTPASPGIGMKLRRNFMLRRTQKVFLHKVVPNLGLRPHSVAHLFHHEPGRS